MYPFLPSLYIHHLYHSSFLSSSFYKKFESLALVYLKMVFCFQCSTSVSMIGYHNVFIKSSSFFEVVAMHFQWSVFPRSWASPSSIHFTAFSPCCTLLGLFLSLNHKLWGGRAISKINSWQKRKGLHASGNHFKG